jgi:hypothetical protein
MELLTLRPHQQHRALSRRVARLFVDWRATISVRTAIFDNVFGSGGKRPSGCDVTWGQNTGKPRSLSA